ncbi:MAG: hypothetical protein KDK51_10005 [Deltaproteobacteria bacterium]|nr:hypothetical protein [Deltaproteobacteria bacterium]
MHAETLEYQQQWLKIRKALLQMDSQKTRCKSLKALKNMLTTVDDKLVPVVWMSLAVAYYYDNVYNYSIYYCKKTLERYPLHPEAIFCATFLVHLYRLLGMKKERYEAEGSRFRLMKRMIMQSENQQHRLFALQELRQEFADRDLLQDFYAFFNQTLRHNPHGKLLDIGSLTDISS